MLRLHAPRNGSSPNWTVRGTHRGRSINKSTGVTTRDDAEVVLLGLKNQLDAGDGIEWKQIQGFSRYEISDNGLVRRLPAILKQTTRRSGHLAVTIYNDHGKAWRAGVHQLVAHAFMGFPPDGKPYACHKNGKPSQNTKGNLYWGSAADNAADTVRHASLRKAAEIAKSVRLTHERR